MEKIKLKNKVGYKIGKSNHWELGNEFEINPSLKVKTITNPEEIIDFFLKTNASVISLNDYDTIILNEIVIPKDKDDCVIIYFNTGLEANKHKDDMFAIYVKELKYDFINYEFNFGNTWEWKDEPSLNDNTFGVYFCSISEINNYFSEGFKFCKYPEQKINQDGSKEIISKFVSRCIDDAVFKGIWGCFDNLQTDIIKFGIKDSNSHIYVGSGCFYLHTKYFIGGPVETYIFVKIENPFIEKYDSN